MSTSKRSSSRRAARVARAGPQPVAKAGTQPAVVEFLALRAWETWLKKNHASSAGVWARLRKKAAGAGYIEYAQLLDAALCYGWIDALRKSHDERSFLQKFTPRGKRSIWSKINRDKALALIRAGRMQPAGLAEVERAKADGRWDAAYDSYAASKVPPDLAAALRADARAARAFAALDSRNRYAILFRTHGAKKPETRARRIAGFVAMLARGERIYP